MNYRYSDYSVEQLRELAGEFKEKEMKAERLGNISEAQIFERKRVVAMAYMLNPEDFEPGKTYAMKGDPGHNFKINYINGVFAWGNRVNLLGELYEKDEAVPISILEEQS